MRAHCLLVAQLALAAAAAALNAADVPCGANAAKTKIVGGGRARPGQFPWLVSLRQGGKHWCGGTLVTKWFVVTAAHCIKTRPATSFTVVAGEHDVTKPEAKEQRLPVQAAVLHPGYKPGRFRHDLAVLRLAAPAAWGPRVQPACLPAAAAAVPANRTATVAGWGWTDEPRNGGAPADLLQWVDVPVMAPDTCTARFAAAGRRNKLRKGQMCAGFAEGGKDGCQGDSGGPLLLPEAGRATLVGVVSAGIGCGRPGLPGVYTDVASYMDWITEKVQ